MDLKNLSVILDLLRLTGGKYIIVEKDKPTFVLMNFNEYQKICARNKIENYSKEELIKKINKDIALWHAAQKEKEQNIISPSPKEDLEYFFKTEDNFVNSK